MQPDITLDMEVRDLFSRFAEEPLDRRVVHVQCTSAIRLETYVLLKIARALERLAKERRRGKS